MPWLWTLGVAALALAITWNLFRRVSRPRGALLVGLGLLETLWFGVALARLSARSWHNPPAVLRAMAPLLLLDVLGLVALRRRSEAAHAREPRLLIIGWVLLRLLIPTSLYLALSQSL